MNLSRRSALAVLVLSVTVVAACKTGHNADDEVRKIRARALYEQGLRSLNDKQISLGLVSLKESVSLDPENATYRNALGVLYLDMRNSSSAQAEFSKAVEIDPTYAEAEHNLGLSYAQQGRYEQAITAYRKALSLPLYTTPEVAYYNMGLAYAQSGRPREAEESLRTAIQLEPKLAAGYYQLGIVLMGSGRRDDARAAFRRARDLEPTSAFGQAATEALKGLGDGG